MRGVLLLSAVLAAGCAKTSGGAFFGEARGVVAELTPDPNEPLSRLESWQGPGGGVSWRHRSEVTSPLPLDQARARVGAWASGAGFTASEPHWSSGETELRLFASDAGGTVAEVFRGYSGEEATSMLDTFVLTGLTQLNYGDAKAFLDAHGVRPTYASRSWSASRGARLELGVEIPIAEQDAARKYLEHASQLERGKDTTISFRPDGARTMVTIRQPTPEELSRSGSTPVVITLAVERPRDTQMW